jgi:hypothetical protein
MFEAYSSYSESLSNPCQFNLDYTSPYVLYSSSHYVLQSSSPSFPPFYSDQDLQRPQLTSVGAVHLEHNVRGLESPINDYLADLFHPDHWPNWSTVSPSKNYLGKGLKAKRKLSQVTLSSSTPATSSLTLSSDSLDAAHASPIESGPDSPAQSILDMVASMRVVRGRRDMSRSPRRPRRPYVVMDNSRRPILSMRTIVPDQPSFPAGISMRRTGGTLSTKEIRMRATRLDTSALSPRAAGRGEAGGLVSSLERTGDKGPLALPLVVSRFTPFPPLPPRMAR